MQIFGIKINSFEYYRNLFMGIFNKHEKKAAERKEAEKRQAENQYQQLTPEEDELGWGFDNVGQEWQKARANGDGILKSAGKAFLGLFGVDW